MGDTPNPLYIKRYLHVQDGPNRGAASPNALDEQLAEDGEETIAPHRKNRKPENATQDRRPLRRYKGRWKVERFFAWPQNFRRLVTP